MATIELTLPKTVDEIFAVLRGPLLAPSDATCTLVNCESLSVV
jgi:hypothetical protein